MLGKRPRPLLRTTSKSVLIPSDGFDGQPAAFCHNSLVSKKHPGPALSVPRQVIIGFDLGVENKPSDACLSPRSVLDQAALSPPREKQAAAARSPRSCLRSLLSGKKGSQGVGLGIIVDIQAEEEEDAKGPFCSPVPTAGHSQPISIAQNLLQQHRVREHDGDDEVSRHRIANPRPKPSQDNDEESGWARKVSNPEGMDDGIAPWQRRVPHSHHSQDMEDDEEINIRESIFSPASPPSNCCSLEMPSMGFLSTCFFCRCSLLQGKDIFMYRGDRAFCSAECRYQQIVIDERKERRAAAVAAYFYPAVPNPSPKFLGYK